MSSLHRKAARGVRRSGHTGTHPDGTGHDITLINAKAGKSVICPYCKDWFMRHTRSVYAHLAKAHMKETGFNKYEMMYLAHKICRFRFFGLIPRKFLDRKNLPEIPLTTDTCKQWEEPI